MKATLKHVLILSGLLGAGTALAADWRKEADDTVRLQKLVETIEAECSRNERAALAFTLIERLRTSKDSGAEPSVPRF